MNQRTHHAIDNGLPTTGASQVPSGRGAPSRKTRRVSFGFFAVLSLIAASMLLRPASAQTPPEPTKAEPFFRQELVNPYPKDKGNEQNRGRGMADIYWGITNGNLSYKQFAYSRTPDLGLSITRTGYLETDGYGFPRGAYQGGIFRLSPNIVVPLTQIEQAAGAPAGNSTFLPTTGPSTNLAVLPGASPNPVYYRAPAQVRPNVPAQLYPLQNRYVWNVSPDIAIPGSVAGQQIRFRVRPFLPNPPDPQDPNNVENRVDDARYIVYYYVRIGNTNNFVPRSKVFIVSQLGGGEQDLLNTDGQPAFFPFFTTATNVNNLPIQPDLGFAFQGVMLDDSTTDDGQNLWVIADTLNLVRSVDVITGTPTVTAPHGGRRAADADPFTPGYQKFANGTQPIQPTIGSQKQDPAIALPVGSLATDIINPLPITAFDFVNIPDDPRYDPNSAQFDATETFLAWNVSVLFKGPESLLEPRLLDADPGNPTPAPPAYPYPAAPQDLPGTRVHPGTPNRPQNVPIVDPVTGQVVMDPNNGNAPQHRTATSVDATNNNIYRFDPRQAYDPANPANNPPVPYFSHMQVLVARTEYVLDPENGVPADQKDGSLSIPVGCVYCLDWLTGAPIWRFPDRTYLPGNARNRYMGYTPSGQLTPLPGITDPNDGSIARNAQTNEPITEVPGVGAADKNGDGVIQDDEVYIVGTAGNRSGGVFASVTYEPKVWVRGNVQLPTYDTTAPNGLVTLTRPDGTQVQTLGSRIRTAQGTTVTAPPGRYYSRPDPNVAGSGYQPVQVGMAFIAAANGVMYAVDAYGNNDNDYFPDPGDYRFFGQYRPGTTNVLWTFGTSNSRRNHDHNGALLPNNETLQEYYTRLKAEVPGTGSFGQAAPVLAYRRDEKDTSSGQPLDPQTDEFRLFAANQNGVLYAMNARADAGLVFDNGGNPAGVLDLPYHKETNKPVVARDPMTGNPILGPLDLKWWFQARGSIDSTPAIALMRQNAGFNNGNPNQVVRKGVYFTSLEGRVYCMDWEGPVTRTDHLTALNWDQGLDGATSGPQVVAATATQLNDQYLFHNVLPATANAIPDQTEGDIRPRWTFPSLYRDIGRNAAPVKFTQPADAAHDNPDIGLTGVEGIKLSDPETTIGPIASSPVLIDFPWKDPLVAGAQTKHITYLAFQAPDATQNGLPVTQSRLYLLDQVGDRANFLTNAVVRGTGQAARVFAQPKDRFSPKALLGDCAPAWTYRLTYDWYQNGGTGITGNRNIARRNSPIVGAGPNFNPPLTNAELNTDPGRGLPTRRIQPTIFIGGIGRVYAIDFDPETALFMRWRTTYNATNALTPLPNYPPLGAPNTQGPLFPGPEAVRDRLAPIDPILDPAKPGQPAQRAALADRKLLVRTIPLAETPTAITNLVISGGPMQNRSTLVQALPGNVTPSNPSVPPDPTNDAPNLRPTYIDETAPDVPATPPSAARFDNFGIFVNQDINDPISTTEGERGSLPTNPVTDSQNRIPNTAYQYPMLYVTDEAGTLQAVSTNVEGEDYDTDMAAIGESSTVGWALFDVSPDRFDLRHILHFIVEGAGGPAGVAVVTNAYFPSLSPTFANVARETATPNDPFAAYPNGEPNQTSPTPYYDTTNVVPPIVAPGPTVVPPLANNDDPRPDFRPRSFSPGVAPNPPGDPVGVAADFHTGQSGFPLDLNGLFYDKRFAGRSTIIGGTVPPTSQNRGLYDVANPAALVPPTGAADVRPIPGQHPNGDYNVHIQLPGYSFIGGELPTLDPAATYKFSNVNNQVPDGARTTGNGSQVPPTSAGNPLYDDINPSGQNVCWIFTGGLDGVFKAYTPAAGGQSSGFFAGRPVTVSTIDTGDVRGFPQVAIVDQATFEALRTAATGNATLPGTTPAQLIAASIARRGGRNFYEYGETVYIVVYDLLAQTTAAGEPIYNPGTDWYTNDRPGLPSVSLEARSLNNNAPVFSERLNLARGTGGKPTYYYQQAGNPLYDNDPTSPFFDPANPNRTPFGLAFFRFTLGQPTQTRPMTPGDVIQIHVAQDTSGPAGALGGVAGGLRTIVGPPGAGANSREQTLASNADSVFSIANPIAVQGFLRQTTPPGGNGQLLPVGAAKANAADTENGVGPFNAQSDQLNGEKTRVADAAQPLTPITNDPDKSAYEYSQALTNGNTLQRRDLRRFITRNGNLVINDTFNTILKETVGGNSVDEPLFYFPVMVSAGYVGHGETGSTDTGTNQQNLRIMNRSLRPTLGNIRVAPSSDFILWRSWPGRVPNADANVYDAAGNVTDDLGNPRFTPAGMDVNGRTNPLPWETGVNESKPWNPTAPANTSPDYPPIPARQNNAIRVTAGGTAVTEGTGTLAALVNDAGNGILTNTLVGQAVQPGTALPARYATSAAISVPKYQPANLVATHNLTTTYQPASTDDTPAGGQALLTGVNPGPLQLPRGNNGIASRDLFVLNNDGTASQNRAIAPYGYTVLMSAFIDYDGSGNLAPVGAQVRNTGRDPNNPQSYPVGTVAKAYREFEMSFGVPIDMSLKVVESTIDAGKLPHSFGIQNGLLGYNPGAGNPAFAPGLLPSPLFDTTLIPNVNSGVAPYGQYFKKFTIQNTGNVNLWNLRASQRTETNGGNANYQWGSGNTFTYFGMRSPTVDPRQGILAVSADPGTSLLGTANLTPLVITSLDKQYDGAWDQYVQNGPPAFSGPFTQPINGGQSPYQLYYQQLGGRHTLHKPRVGVNATATLGVPDVPANQALRPVDQAQPAGLDTVIGLGVPVGTPVGEYTSALASNPLVVFEDHDTNNAYAPTPDLPGGWTPAGNARLAAAGPFYSGSQAVPPGANPILSFGNGNNPKAEGIWRARRFVPVNGQNIPEYQPATVPGITLKATVTEAPLTGDIADRAVENAAQNLAPSIATGRLPGVDFFPLIDANGPPVNGLVTLRAAAALSPAAYRSPDGSLHVYFSRNYGGNINDQFAQPGQPFNLFHTHLVWNQALGTFVASTSGTPLMNDGTAPSAAGNQASWFTPPQVIAPGAAGESNVSPFVLQTANGASLFWVNAKPSQAGAPTTQVFYTGLNADGTPATQGLPLIGKVDASIQRYSPRALFYDDGTIRNTIVFYYGGSSGRWGIYYVSRPAGTNGAPLGTPVGTNPNNGNIENVLPLPNSVASASDPTPVLRSILLPGNAQPTPVIDVYYTGVSRATQTPDIYMTRYQLVNTPRGIRLVQLRLPKVVTERLTAPGRDPIYQSRHIGWFRTLNNANLAAGLLPIIAIGPDANNPVVVGAADKWQTDTATGVLYQTFKRNKRNPVTKAVSNVEGIVYVDPAAGTVRFRGAGAPSAAEYVFATYVPQTYRITVGGVSNVGPFGFTDNRTLAPTLAIQPTGVVIRRDTPMVVGRHWLFWQKGAEANRPSTLFYAVRRVGIDLKDPSIQGARLANNDTIVLSQPDANRNQRPRVDSVTINGLAIPYEVDYITGRIFVEPQNEGLPVTVLYHATSTQAQNPPTGIQVRADGILSYIDEIGPTGQGTTGLQVPLSRSVNEGQPYAFLDTTNVAGSVTRTNPAPAGDPTLLPGRVWLFWSSPRGRIGSQLIGTTDPFPGGFDLYWQTLAPALDPLTPTILR